MEGRKETVKERTQENPCEMKNVMCEQVLGTHSPTSAPGVKHFTHRTLLYLNPSEEAQARSLGGYSPQVAKNRTRLSD